jgi:hypothetical protein
LSLYDVSFPKGKACRYNVPLQTEGHCPKLLDFEWKQYNANDWTNNIYPTILRGKENRTHVTIECRAQIRKRLEGKKQNLKEH